jgi:hypothetical protein
MERTMFPKDIGVVIAVRELSFTDNNNSKNKLVVAIGKPEPFPNSEGYYCPFQISGGGSEKIKYAAGIDAVQSLQLVMEMIGATLQFMSKELDGELRWEGTDTNELGFPSVT